MISHSNSIFLNKVILVEDSQMPLSKIDGNRSKILLSVLLVKRRKLTTIFYLKNSHLCGKIIIIYFEINKILANGFDTARKNC